MAPILCIPPVVIAVGGFVVATLALLYLVEPGFWQWVRRGGPDYLDEPDEIEIVLEGDATVEIEYADGRRETMPLIRRGPSGPKLTSDEAEAIRRRWLERYAASPFETAELVDDER